MSTRNLTTRKRHLLATSLAAAGLLLTGGLAQAADWDVSTIYGRGSPPNAHITAHPDASSVSTRSGTAGAAAEYQSADRSSATSAEPIRHTYPEHASYTRASASTPGEATLAESTGRIHGETLDGTPLVEGRGMRQGVDQYATAPVYAEPAFDVADILGRSSPPAPADAPDFGLPS